MNPWDKIYQRDGARYSSRLEYWPHLIKLFQQNRVEKILDLGCGSGKHLLALAKQGFETYGLDISQEGIALAQQTFAKHKLRTNLIVHSTHQPLPFQDQFFDATISLRTLNHGTIKQIKTLVGELERVLKPDGYIFITTLMIPGGKKCPELTTLNSLPVKMIEPRTYLPLKGKETGVVHYIFNKEILLSVFTNFQVIKFWVEYGRKKWERYYCLLGRKK